MSTRASTTHQNKLPFIPTRKNSRTSSLSDIKLDADSTIKTVSILRSSAIQKRNNIENRNVTTSLSKFSQTKTTKFFTPVLTTKKDLSIQNHNNTRINKKYKNKSREQTVGLLQGHNGKMLSKTPEIITDQNFFKMKHEINPITSPNLKKIEPNQQFLNCFYTPKNDFDKLEDEKYNKMLQEDIQKDYYGDEVTDAKSIEFEPSPDIIGGFDEQKFFTYYKNLDKLLEEKSKNKILNSTSGIAIIKKMKEMNSPPVKLGFFKERKNKSELNIAHYAIGDKYAPIIAEGIKYEQFNSIGLSDNGLSHVGAEIFLPTISPELKDLDLSINKIGASGTSLLCKLLMDHRYKLQNLSLESNRLGDKAVMQLAKACRDNVYLTKLNLSNNQISEFACLEFAKLLEENVFIKELYFHYNKIKGIGGSILFNALKNNKNLCILDLSWNSLGSNSGMKFSQSLSECLSINESLMHLDISYNNISNTETPIIAEGLAKNHSLYGFHYDGNQGSIDCRGFLSVTTSLFQKNSFITNSNVIPTFRIEGVKCKRVFSRRNIYQNQLTMCWICDGWSEITFYWFPGKSGNEFKGDIYLHLSFDGYKPHPMNLTGNRYYELKEICPPLGIKYFFTINGAACVAKDQPHKLHKTIKIKNLDFGDTKIDLEVQAINFVQGPINTEIFDQEYFTPNISLFPRYVDTHKMSEPQTYQWSFSNSIFKDYKYDTDDLLMKCFEFDWQCSKIPKIIKTAEILAEVKTIFRKNYKWLKDTYKYYASLGVVGEVWSIPLNDYKNFIMSIGLVDQKTLRLNDIDFNFIAVNASDIKSFRNPERALIRFQFLEILVRLAEDKFMKTSICSNYYDAVNKIFKDHVTPIISNFDHQKWRLEKYWIEECDRVYNAYLPVLNEVYRCYSGAKSKPGQKKFMCLDELRKLCIDAGLLDDSFVGRDLNLAFNLSMMTQVDEINYDRHFQMSFIEFLECIARIADKADPYDYNSSNTSSPIKPNLSLHIKLENFIRILYEHCCSEDFRDEYGLPNNSIFESKTPISKPHLIRKKTSFPA